MSGHFELSALLLSGSLTDCHSERHLKIQFLACRKTAATVLHRQTSLCQLMTLIQNTHNNPHTAPRAGSIALAERTANALAVPSTKGQQDCSPAPCCLTAYCDTQKFSGSSINGEFSSTVSDSTEHLHDVSICHS